MPELPEIEALRDLLSHRLADRRVEGVAVRQVALVKTFDPALEELIGEPFAGARRHGKHLLLDFESELTLAIHLGIGGRVLLSSPGSKPSRVISLDLTLDDGSLLRVAELGTKKRSSLHLLRGSSVAGHLGHLGVDALAPEFTVEALSSLLAKHRSQIKGLLEDQRLIAGIGNAYSDEILWEARLAPLRMTTTLSEEDARRLHAGIRSVLDAAVARAREDNYLLLARGDERHAFRVHRRSGEPCPRCGEKIASIFYAENSLQYCPACQNEGRAYADRRLSRLLK